MKKIYGEILIVSIFTAFMGQVHFYPFNTDFRIAFGVIVFPLLLMYFYKIPIFSTAVVTSIFIFTLRAGIDVTSGIVNMSDIFYKHFPAFMYYISYGIIIDRLGLRNYTTKSVHLIIILSMADIFSNFFELIMRNQLLLKSIDSIMATIFLAAFMRSFITVGLFRIIKYYNVLITKEEHQKRYNDLLLLTAKLKSETLFLKKSMQDIENAMEKSYKIYNSISNGEYKENSVITSIMEDSLNLSIDIHEIKKDYHRIVSSMEKIMPNKEPYKVMKISYVFDTIRNIFLEYMITINKEIELDLELKVDFDTHEYYIIMSILNNLIQNSIEASLPQYSHIKVTCSSDEADIIFTVMDNGKGISNNDMDSIFDPGFTTKYDAETGYISTGLGLAHVNMLVKYLNGIINVNTKKTKYTEFILRIPKKRLVFAGNQEEI